jgi:D-alanine-D-alanine ligase-like ATP-grasp enzyme
MATQQVPAMFESLTIPYSGAPPQTLGMCFDKALVRSVAVSLGVPVPLEYVVEPDDDASDVQSAIALYGFFFSLLVRAFVIVRVGC